ncbi:Stp1/IreP family PP2C-type Ser/Thr phosphatase [Candidatus Sumerlaeota bacterium]|nr:Stp1/IreP family PP2C-type Ser/Thr phosphatase [Candidatus Sumerlaeota bacterium]
MKLISNAQTDIGLQRATNEDAFFASDEYGTFVVADGMGGHAAGEVASNTSIQIIRNFIERYQKDPGITWPYGFDKRLKAEANALITGIRIANVSLYAMQSEKPELQGMGTTIAATQFSPDGTLTIAHVGDSRVYRLREGELIAMTRDHSWVNEQLARNLITEEEARTHRFRNVITRALGYKTDMSIDVKVERWQTGDTYLICSDGLSGLIDDNKLCLMMRMNKDLKLCVKKFVDQANAEGGSDNITAIIIRVED